MSMHTCNTYLPLVNFITLGVLGIFISIILYKIWLIVKKNESSVDQINLKISKAQQEATDKLIAVAERYLGKKK